mmetsp:Transcript_35601/g.115377  ORF Transcript_35601/g.115377 Transcript_35601/m.115377 type:complete len:99 (+) Transcript_35601:1529-1825(+)
MDFHAQSRRSRENLVCCIVGSRPSNFTTMLGSRKVCICVHVRVAASRKVCHSPQFGIRVCIAKSVQLWNSRLLDSIDKWSTTEGELMCLLPVMSWQTS